MGAMKQDKAFAKWKKKHKVKLCPHCGAETFKTGGCDEMECDQCKKKWDWLYDVKDEKGNRTDETFIETLGFACPRLVREGFGAKEFREDGLVGAVVGGSVYAAIVVPFTLPFTVVLGPPALACRGTRKIKRGVKRIFSSDD